MADLTDIKKSLLETVKTRIKDIPKESFFEDPPQGKYDRPCGYLAFKDKKQSKGGMIGTILYDYFFDFIVEVLESETDNSDKVRAVETAFVQGETLSFWHWIGNVRHTREGRIEVKSFSISEGKKDREKNSIRGELIVTF